MQQRFRKARLSTKFPNLMVAESLRHGGVSPAPYASLNLSWYSPDDNKHIEKNRALFFEDLGFLEKEAAGSFQIHETQVQLVEQAGQSKGFDALITNKKGILLNISIADCTPIAIYDPVRQAIGGAHAGWKGTIGKIVENTLDAMKEAFGTQAADCFAYIGTCIDYDSFEVDNDVAQYFEGPFKRWDEGKQKFFVDLKKANQQQLINKGIPSTQIEISPYSTVKNNTDYFSHRKEKGKTGRSLTVIGMK